MGLDMHLIGEKFYWTDWEHPENNLCEDGFKLETKRLELGYWRKHPDLHGFIVQRFADGVDECQEIKLGLEDVEQILQAIKAKELPKTTGFFFGESDGSRDEESITIFEKAIAWVKAKDAETQKHYRTVIYRASW